MDQRPAYEDFALLQAAVEQAFNAVLVTDANLDQGGPLIEFCNPAFCRMTGYRAEELIGRSPRILQGPQTDRAVIEELRSCLYEDRYFQGSTVNYRKDGTPYYVEWNISPIRDEDGNVTHYVSVQRNITARVEAERMRDLLAKALDASSDPILITDERARICFINQSFEAVNGYTAAEVMGRTPKFLQGDDNEQNLHSALTECLRNGQAFRATFRNQRKDGSHYFADQSITPLHDSSGRISHYVSISKDISDAIEKAQQLSEKARRDALTGLLNRGAGDQLLTAQLKAARNTDAGFSVLMGDIDRFKGVNDQFGHLVGDRILKAIAQTLLQSIRNGDHAIRWGGEEFLIILPDTGTHGALGLAARIQALLAQQPDNDAGPVTLSWGVTAWRPGESADELLDRADVLLYTAKKQGRNQVAADAN